MLAQQMERRQTYGGAIAATGLILAVIQIVQGIQQLDAYSGSAPEIVFVFETVPFVLIGLTLVYAGYWLWNEPEIEQYLDRVVLWGVGSALLFAAVASLIIFSQVVTLAGEARAQAPYIAMNHITVGAVVGVLLGIYDAQSTARQRAVERERDRVEQFANKAADINNYGRELNRSDSIDEVSSLCIQALQTFLGLTEIAFVITDEAESELVDNTVVGVSDDSLVTVARDSLDQTPATVVTHESLPDDLQARGGQAISLLVTNREDSSVVLLAVTEDSDDFADEDVQLLEMLVAHAATALDRIYDHQLAAHEETAT